MATSKYASAISSSADDDMSQIILVLHGQMGAGKSTLAASASKFFPKELPTVRCKGPAKIKLSDMLWLSVDRQATIGLKERGIQVDKFDFNEFQASGWKKWTAQKFLGPPSIVQTIQCALQVAQDAVLNGGKKWLVLDTNSALDRALNVYWEEHCPANKAGVRDTQAMYGRIFVAHKLLHDTLRSLPCGLIYCCHSKAVSEENMSETQKLTKIALTAPGSPTLVPDITGKGALAYKADCSLELYVKAISEPGKKGALKRSVLTCTNIGEAKNRFELSLSPEEPAHLGKILAKIAA